MVSKPRKRYRPRPVGRPVGRAMRDELMLPFHLSMQRLTQSPDEEEQCQAWHDLMVLTEAWRDACADRRDVARILDHARSALLQIWERRWRSWLPTGDQLQILRLAVSTCDEVSGYLRTDQLSTGLRKLVARLEFVD